MKRKIIILFLLIFMSQIVCGQAGLRMVIVNGNISALNNIIERNELWDLSQSELRILRNTIFAKYGYIFRSTDLQNHFVKFAWYSAVNSNVDNCLTKIDNENISRIQQREQSLAEMIAFQEKTNLWIRSKQISQPLSNYNLNGVNLYQNPTLYSEVPERWTVSVEMEPGFFANMPIARCFAMGQFLTLSESSRIMQTVNPELTNSIVFNPSTLFLNDSMYNRLYKPFKESGVYLIVFPKGGSVPYNIQANQVLTGAAKNILILPWSVYYTVYKISDEGEWVLVDEVAAN